MTEITVIGVGNEFRSDDALGILVAREVRRRHEGNLRVVEADGEGASLMEAWEGSDHVVLIDAVAAAGPPGTILRVDASAAKIPTGLLPASSHLFGVAEAIEMARELHRLPRTTILYGVVGESFDFGEGLSDKVLRSVPDLLQSIEDEVHALHAH